MSIFSDLMEKTEAVGSVLLVIVDPDKHELDSLPALGHTLEQCGVDGIMVGGTYVYDDGLRKTVRLLKESVSIPVIIFPGGSGMSSEIVPEADAILFLSLISGRNADYLIGEQVRAGLRAKQAGLERIPVGYILVSSEATASIEAQTGTRALPVTKPNQGMLHAVAGESIGSKLIYLDRGSGAEKPVPVEYAKTVCQGLDIPVMVSGGIRKAKQISDLAKAGVKIFAVGSVIEGCNDLESSLCPILEAAHWRTKNGS